MRLFKYSSLYAKKSSNTKISLISFFLDGMHLMIFGELEIVGLPFYLSKTKISSFALPFHLSKTKINKYIGTMTSQTFSFKTNIPMYK